MTAREMAEQHKKWCLDVWFGKFECKLVFLGISHLLITWIGLNNESVLKTGINDADIQDSCLIIKKIISVRHLEEQGGSIREACLQQNIFYCMNWPHSECLQNLPAYELWLCHAAYNLIMFAIFGLCYRQCTSLQPLARGWHFCSAFLTAL